jgi:hypothetical protein
MLDDSIEIMPATSMKLLPVKKGLCRICAADHPATYPHNKDSLYYQMQFKGRFDRWPTWADAVAHCDEKMRETWTVLLKKKGHWNEPPEGADPIAQDYQDGLLPPGRMDG